MNSDELKYMDQLLEFLIELLDIPPSHYQQATDRYKSLGDWLHRKESKVAEYDPEVYAQGSFRYGTVIRPLLRSDEYDLDLVCRLILKKANITQKKVKGLVGNEVQAYAHAYSFKEPATEKYRCWRLDYSDHVKFHMDILPCVPEDVAFIDQLCRLGVPKELAASAVAITDTRHAKYSVIAVDWPSSNPHGVAGWFEARMRAIAQERLIKLVEKRLYASVDDVPAYEWKTPLQRSIQILKRHRDVMFKNSPEWKPLSMIITTLATHSYSGESGLYDALVNIIDHMPNYISPKVPRIPNPVNPAEDFADRWSKDPRFEQNFRLWHAQVKADMTKIAGLIGKGADITRTVREKFGLTLTADMQKELEIGRANPAPYIVTAGPAVQISSPPKPWRRNG